MRNVHLADQPKGDHLAEHHSHPVRRGVLARLAPIAIVVGALALIIALVGTPGHDGEPSALARAPRHAHVPSSQASARTESNPRVNVTIASRPSGISVPRCLLGISTEYWAMPLFERHEPQFERLLALLRVPGNGPLLLRIGGDSADQAVFGLRVPRLPRAILELTPDWFRQTSALVRAVGAKLILDQPRHRPPIDGRAVGASGRNRTAPWEPGRV